MLFRSVANIELYSDCFDGGDYMYGTFNYGQKIASTVYFHRLWDGKAWQTDLSRTIRLGRQGVKHTAEITITAGAFARTVFLDYAEAAQSYRLSDNYFDMEKGEVKRVEMILNQPFDPAKLTIKTFADEWDA